MELILKLTVVMKSETDHPGKKYAWKFANQQIVNGEKIGGTGQNACKYIPADGTIEQTISQKISPFILRTIVLEGTNLWTVVNIKILNITLFNNLPESIDLQRSQEQMLSILRRGEYKICQDNSWGDPHNYARGREIDVANLLGHQISSEYSGADGIDEDGECEYKTTINEKIKGTYNGISVKATWEEQKEYLEKEKIGKYKNHYFARYNGANIVEVYKLTASQVLEHILPKLEKQFQKENKGADPRLGTQVTYSFITKCGEKVFPQKELLIST